jgi:hypothetical protein
MVGVGGPSQPLVARSRSAAGAKNFPGSFFGAGAASMPVVL